MIGLQPAAEVGGGGEDSGFDCHTASANFANSARRPVALPRLSSAIRANAREAGKSPCALRSSDRALAIRTLVDPNPEKSYIPVSNETGSMHSSGDNGAVILDRIGKALVSITWAAAWAAASIVVF